MTVDAKPMTVLTEDDSWSLLPSISLGRPATIVAGQPEIFPVNFVVQLRRSPGADSGLGLNQTTNASNGIQADGLVNVACTSISLVNQGSRDDQ